MMSTDERLAYMADQILRNFASRGQEAAIAATLDHIGQFWDPGMKSRAAAMPDAPGVVLSDGVRATFMRLRDSQPAS
ncbi:formate dehydrogenase subunit delta [Novosphingobium mangrovi (ex Huang et al. 2023)]|uniref:Formate dehydrogenase subunit delta n=1 Tax=Novosphingobium mangrovi (ex Huang et al. 2023) TaxID=2976432 RepID=A0ABT2HZW7_9SPHN|nr:formate dehydrogenase subunit delta [Novosphingobium mangrovi (ex Huang et al. 2023)]MCT2398088.1 formate dehydrogenase subunit delta [Novosphingobium mangrovi (ex Huang et al. 2023)]